MEQSKTLGQFYRDYYWWVNCAMPYTTKFDPAWGLCSNLTSWAKAQGMPYYERENLSNEMVQQFKDSGLDRHYPFSSMDEYDEDSIFTRHHKNKQRMQWVKAHIPEDSHG